MTAHLVPLDCVIDVIPASLHTIYAYSSRGRWSSWLTREGPDGGRGRHLWCDVPAALEFWRAENKPHVGELIAAAAGQVRAKGGAPAAA